MEQFDVVVIGTGAAGLTAAVVAAEEGARVGVFEKADLVGGTAAWSGGQVWIPNNPHIREIGIADDRDRAITYIMSLSRDLLDADLVEAYVDAGPEMIGYLEAGSPVQFYAVPGMPDYHPEFPAGTPRAAEPSSARSTRSPSSASGPTGSRRRRTSRTPTSR